jgi:hypothetical protein
MLNLTPETRLATMVDFTLTDEQKALRDFAHDFATKEIRPVASGLDTLGENVDALRFAGGSFVRLDCRRRGIWATRSLWGRVVTDRGG